MEKKTKFRINRSGDVDTTLWDRNWTARLWLKFLGFYIIKYTKHFPQPPLKVKL